MKSAYNCYFQKNIEIIDRALKSVDSRQMEQLLSDCEKTLAGGNKIIASGLGKNVPICDKFVGTMLSLGMSAGFLYKFGCAWRYGNDTFRRSCYYSH